MKHVPTMQYGTVVDKICSIVPLTVTFLGENTVSCFVVDNRRRRRKMF